MQLRTLGLEVVVIGGGGSNNEKKKNEVQNGIKESLTVKVTIPITLRQIKRYQDLFTTKKPV